VLFLKTGQTKIVQRGGYFGRYLPSGHLVFLHQGALLAVPFDLARYATRGMPAPILEDIAGNRDSASGQLDFSRTGTLVYMSGKFRDTGPLLWLDAAEKKEPLLSAPGLTSPRFSPNGKRLAFASNGDISVYDLARDSTTRLTFSNGSDGRPVWTPDGNHIVYASLSGAMWWLRPDGSDQPQRIYALKDSFPVPASFTPDGRHLAFHQSVGNGNRDLWTLPFDTTDPDHPKTGAPELFLAAKGQVVDPAFSPDGRWLAYASSESGNYHVFVRPFPEGATGGGQVQISTAPGRFPLWSRTAKELFYVPGDGHIMMVPYTVNGRTLAPDKPRQWTGSQILVGPTLPLFDLAPDGKRFAVFPAPVASAGAEKPNLHMIFLLNFFDYLKLRLPP
jgi:dipeptidyl aminopeptidase/acylaminoacyl peptidase